MTEGLRGRLLVHSFLSELEKIAAVAPGGALRSVGQMLAPAENAVLRTQQVAQAARPTIFGRLGIFPGQAGKAFRTNLAEAQSATRVARSDLKSARRQALSELNTPNLNPDRHAELTRYLDGLNRTQRPEMPNWRIPGAPPTPTAGQQIVGGVRRAAMVGVPLAIGGGALAYAGSRYLQSQRDPYAQ